MRSQGEQIDCVKYLVSHRNNVTEHEIYVPPSAAYSPCLVRASALLSRTCTCVGTHYTASYRAVDGTEDLAAEETGQKVGRIHVAAQRAFLASYSSLTKSKKANDVRQTENDMRKELKVGYEMAADHMTRMIV